MPNTDDETRIFEGESMAFDDEKPIKKPIATSKKKSLPIKISSRNAEKKEPAPVVKVEDCEDDVNNNSGGLLEEGKHHINGDVQPTKKLSTGSRETSQNTNLLNSLMETYLDQDYMPGRKLSQISNAPDEPSKPQRKQPPPPARKPSRGLRVWEDPRDHQRVKTREKVWPPKESPKDIGAYVVESYGQTDPYSKKLIKDIQKSKREEEDKLKAEKRSEVLIEQSKPVSMLRSTYSYKPESLKPGAQKPTPNITGERSWIKHEKKVVEFDTAPEEPDWMKMIRNRRWKSTVKARFPCKDADKTEFDRRSTTPKNWKRLAKDKNALKMLSEIVGIGAEGEELFMRLANQREKMEEQQKEMDLLTEQELLGYEVAREALGGDAAYSLQMDNPLPAARMIPVPSNTTVAEGSLSGSQENLTNISSYPFTTSQLEAAYLTNQLLRLHPEEFKKLMSLERSRSATLRWQFSADPFDSVHEHQSLPFEIALLASEEPRLQRVMKKILANANKDEYGSSFSQSSGRVSRTQSECAYLPDSDGYESSNSSMSERLVRGRSFKKKAPVPLPKRQRVRSMSPSMMRNSPPRSPDVAPSRSPEVVDDGPVHGLLSDQDIELSEEIAKLQEMTTNIGRDVDEELKSIQCSLEERKKGFFDDVSKAEQKPDPANPAAEIDKSEIASRREGFIKHDLQTSIEKDVRESIPKTRHKVRRINSSAQLDAVFRKRREMSQEE